MAPKWGRLKKNNLYPEERAKRRGNPFFNRPKTRSWLSAKFKFILLGAASVIAAIAWLLFFSRFFLITGVEMSGASDEVKREAEKKFTGQSAKNRWIFFPQSNLFIFNEQEYVSALNENFVFQKLDVKKRLFHRLIIEFEEKENSFVWKEGDKFYYIDDAGRIIKEADPLSINTNQLAVIENQRAPLAEEKKLDQEAERIGYVRSLSDAIKNTHGAPIVAERFILDKDIYTVRLQTASSGPEILFNIKNPAQTQIDRLSVLIKDKLGEEYLKKKYIDLRFGELIYYQ
ncbi:MAG: hypothetical protein WC745_03810 [Patescibacteria group bacterium]|jgi:cell division septal protein FtsQ